MSQVREPESNSSGDRSGTPEPPAPRRRWVLRVFLVLVVLIVLDAFRPPERQLGAKASLAGIRFYQQQISPRLGAGRGQCRFKPTCSNYGRLAVAKHGWFKGGAMTGWRLLRCVPWTEKGTVDYPPGTDPRARPASPDDSQVRSRSTQPLPDRASPKSGE